MAKVSFQVLLGAVLAAVLIMGPTVSARADDPAQPPSISERVTAPAPAGFVIRDFPVPTEVTLCGEKYPLHLRHVYEGLDLELTIGAHAHAQVFLWLKRAGRYFPYIQKRLAEENMPDDLKYLAVAESDLRPHVYSPARALGAWQFIAGTAKRYGLRVDKEMDERLSFENSTEAAIVYLKKLKAMFGTWTLAMAAYNCGEGRVATEIKEQGVRDYFRLNLPYETERYVHRITAIKIILEHPENYGFSFDPARAYKPLPRDQVSIDLSEDLHLRDAAQAIGTDYKTLRELNPELKGREFPKGKYNIYVPQGSGPKMSAFLAGRKSTTTDLNQPKANSGAGNQYYVVRSGDNLTLISRKTGVPISTIKNLNRLKGSKIWVGQKLRLY